MSNRVEVGLADFTHAIYDYIKRKNHNFKFASELNMLTIPLGILEHTFSLKSKNKSVSAVIFSSMSVQEHVISSNSPDAIRVVLMWNYPTGVRVFKVAKVRISESWQEDLDSALDVASDMVFNLGSDYSDIGEQFRFLFSYDAKKYMIRK